MDRERRVRIVDEVLQRALGPELVEPRDGIEQRILANLATAPKRRPWWQWMWIPALAAAAIFAIVIGMTVLHKEQPAPVESKKAVAQPKPEVAVTPEPPAIKRVEPPRAIAKRVAPRTTPKPAAVVAKAEPLPRKDVFPSPTPLTDQERLLLALVNRQRPQAEQIAAEQQAQRATFQKYLETGEVPMTQPTPAQPMR